MAGTARLRWLLISGATCVAAACAAAWWMNRPLPPSPPRVVSTRPARPRMMPTTNMAMPPGVPSAQNIRRTPEPPKVPEAEARALIAAAMSHRTRWSVLPANMPYGLSHDRFGHAWFASTNRKEDDFKPAVEAMAAGGPPVMSGGQLMMIDARGRYWCKSRREPRTLHCYDGRAWLPPHAIGDGKVGTINDTPLAARNGDACFLFKVRGRIELHRCSADGKWSVAVFPMDIAGVDGELIELPDGRVAIAPGPVLPQGNGMPLFISKAIAEDMPTRFDGPAKPTLLIDGDKITTFTPPDLPEEKLQANQAIPLPDGSILVTYRASERVLLCWPSGTEDRAAASAQRWIDQLDAPEPSARNAAREALLRLGPAGREILSRAATQPANQGAQRQDSLNGLAEQLKAGDTAAASKAQLFGGRYQLGSVTVINRAASGAVRLFAMNVKDVRKGDAPTPGFVTVTPAGEWDVMVLSEGRDLDFVTSAIDSAVEDAAGRLWLGNENRVLDLNSPELRLTLGLPAGLRLGALDFADAEGRLYFSFDNKRYVFDSRAPEAESPLAIRQMPLTHLTAAPGAKTAWAIDANNDLVHIGPDGQTSPGPVLEGQTILTAAALRDDAVFVTHRPRERSRDFNFEANLFDGKDWVPSFGFAKRYGPTVAAHAPRFMLDLSGWRGPLHSVASDRGKGAWLHRLHIDDGKFVQRMPADTSLQYFDGKQGQDGFAVFEDPTVAAAHLGTLAHLPPEYVVVGFVDDGRLALVSVPNGGIWGVAWENGRMTKHAIPGGEKLDLSGCYILQSDAGNSWWFRTGDEPGLWAYQGGKIVPLPWTGRPFFADSKDRVWCFEGKHLVLNTGGSVAVDDLDDRSMIVESPDNRLWLLHTAGLTELKTEPSLSLGQTRSWGAPLNDFSQLFVDQAGGLWYGGREGSVAHVQLPK